MINNEPICLKIKRQAPEQANETAELLSYASFACLFNCLFNCERRDCKSGKSHIEKYLNHIIKNTPWFLPAGEYGIDKIQQKISEVLNTTPIINKAIQQEIERRSDFFNHDDSFHKKQQYLPNPAALIVNESKNTCYLTGFIKYQNSIIDSTQNTNSNSVNYLQKAEAILLHKNESVAQQYDLPQNIKGCLHSEIKGSSAMLPYYIKRWFERRGYAPSGNIAATGEIENTNIKEVAAIGLKIKSALKFGYKYIFYPASQKSELIDYLGEDKAASPKLIPIATISELEQRLLFLSEFRQAQTILQQYIEGTRIRKIKIPKLENLINTYFKGLLASERQQDLFKNLQAFFRSCDNIIPSRKLQIISVFIKLLEKNENNTNSQNPENILLYNRFKIAFIKAMLSQASWYGILPYIIKDLNSNSLTKELAQELYQRNVEKFYNHNQCMTVASRFASKARTISNEFWSDNSFALNYQHLWGMSSFDPINMISELSAINSRNNSEEELLIKLISETYKAHLQNPQAIACIGTNPNINDSKPYAEKNDFIAEKLAENYYKPLLKIINEIFKGFTPQKFRYLRRDQRLAHICRIIFNLTQQSNVRHNYNKHIDYLIKILNDFIEYNQIDDSYHKGKILPEFRELLTSKSSYEDKDSIETLLNLAKKNLEHNKKKPEDSLTRLLNVTIREKKNKPDTQSLIDFAIARKNLIDDLYEELKNELRAETISNNHNLNLCINPIYEFVKLILNPDSHDLKLWLMHLNTFSNDYENITSIAGISLFLAYYAGRLYNGEVDTMPEKSKYSSLFMIGRALVNSDWTSLEEHINSLIINQKFDLDFLLSILYLIDNNEERTRIIQYLDNELGEASPKPNFIYIRIISSLTEEASTTPLFNITSTNYLNNEQQYSWSRWKKYVKKDLLQTKRNERKLYFFDMIYNHPIEFLRLPFFELDPELYSLSFLYIIAIKRYRIQKPKLFKRIEKKIVFSGKSLFDTEAIKSIKLLFAYLEKKNPQSYIKKQLLNNHLGLMNMKLALTMLNSLKSNQ